MPDVTTFNIGGTEITIKDETARSTAQNALSKAGTAENNANNALTKVTELENLSRVTVAYSADTETITITTGNHEVA